MNVMLSTIDELGLVITEESEKYSKWIVSRYKMNPEEWKELYSFLITELFSELHNKKELWQTTIVRRLIKLRQHDYFRDSARFNNQTPFICYEGVNEEGEFRHFYETVKSNVNLEREVLMSDELGSFLSTLTTRESQILKLVSEGYQKQEICKMLGVSTNTPRNTMKRIKNMAIEFGINLNY